MGEWEKFFTLHCYLLHQRNSSFPGKMQSRKINRLEAEEDLVEVVYLYVESVMEKNMLKYF